jgi:dihydroflavonol-4-reductase
MPFICPMKLVTGGTGFLGAHLIAELLERGGKVRALRRSASDFSEFSSIMKWRLGERFASFQERLEWVEGDVLDYESLTDALENISEVYHCAAVVSFWPKMRQKMYRINVEGTANLVNASLEKGVSRFCFCSSIAALGRSESSRYIDEETIWADSPDNSNYSISKYLAEMEVWRGGIEGLQPVIVNPGVILGEGDWKKGSCRLLKKAFDGMPVYTSGKNGYVDVRDVSWVMAELMERGISGERYVLVGENTEIKSFFDKAAALSGKKGPVFRMGKLLSALAWRFFSLKSFFDGKEPLVSRETARTSRGQYEYSSRKVEQALGCKLKKTSDILERVWSLPD